MKLLIVTLSKKEECLIVIILCWLRKVSIQLYEWRSVATRSIEKRNMYMEAYCLLLFGNIVIT